MTWKSLTASVALAGTVITGGVDSTVLNEKPIQSEYQLKEHVSVVQRGDVVEATLPWKDQTGLKVKYDMGKATAMEKVKDKRRAEVVTEQVSTDAMKIDVLLNEKPDTNRFCYTIEGWEDYDFFLQPALMPEEIADGAERPEEIVGSYAVYHKTLKNHRMGAENYETGKVVHIPYPYIWSVNDESTKHRAEDFDITDGRMCVTVAQSDLDGMEYPIRLDPTFGYTSAGASQVSNSGWQFNRNTYSAPENGDIQSLSAYLDCYYSSSFNGKWSGGVYNSSGGVLKGGADVSIPYGDSASWYTSNLTSSLAITSSTNYRLVEWGQSLKTKYDVVSDTASYSAYSTSYNTFPSTEPSGTTGTRSYSIYATYTASGGGSTPPTTEGAIIFD